MPQYPVLQPDGQYAIWSTVSDDFIFLGLTAAQCESELARRYPNMESSAIDEVIHGVTYGEESDYMRWPECLAWATYRHGENDADVVLAHSITPDDIKKRAMDILADIKREGELA